MKRLCVVLMVVIMVALTRPCLVQSRVLRSTVKDEINAGREQVNGGDSVGLAPFSVSSNNTKPPEEAINSTTMGGQWVVSKPSRSDEVLEADQQLRIADQIRAHFDSMAPKRPIKPNRSEIDSTVAPTQVSSFDDEEEEDIPEVNTFRSLQSQSHVIYSADEVSMVQDEFVETKYYNEFNSIDKQHHTTGNGFIEVAREGGGDEYGLRMQRGHHEYDAAREMMLMDFKSNPARNEWIPSVDDDEYLI
ncbi:hypothetical protein HHK36_002655 [Tetracentron sinense]|uniref:Uncharacterized protein n=1 Tax=Tetracentron sinense TaxID=13715 RepID=A0A835DN28_TETSI|nr:hypothetical protein HHK36_002655 [Tetracentron sinense]